MFGQLRLTSLSPQVLKDKTGQIAAAGYTALWLPPPSDSVSQQGYLPRDLYNLNSCYGSEGALRECIQVLHEANLKVIADIVINHRCAHSQVRLDGLASCSAHVALLCSHVTAAGWSWPAH